MLLVLLAIIAVLAAALLFLPEDITLVAGSWVIQTHSVVALALFILLLAILYMLARAFCFMHYAPVMWRLWRKAKNQQKRARSLESGVRLLIENDWHAATRVLAAGARLSDKPGIYYLGAAQALHHLGRDSESADMINHVLQADTGLDTAAALTRARLLESRGDRKAAISELQQLPLRGKSGHEIKKHLLQLLCADGRWQQVLTLVDKSGLGHEQKESMRKRAWGGLLRQATERDDRELVIGTWARISRRLRRDDGLLAEYANSCLRLGMGARCEPLLKKRLKRKAAPLPRDLVMLYGCLPCAEADVPLAFVESLLQRHPTHAALLCVAGILCLRTGQWQRGRSYLEASARMEPRQEVYRAMALLQEQQGDMASAVKSYRAAAALTAAGSGAADEEVLSLLLRSGSAGRPQEGRSA